MNNGSSFSTRTLFSGPLEIELHDTACPHIVSLRYQGSANLLASVPEIAIPTLYGDYPFIVGHRLWYASEAMPRSYVPDDEGLTVSEFPDGLLLNGRQEIGTGIRKCIKIHLRADHPQVTLSHMFVERAPEGSVSHTENWELYDGPSRISYRRKSSAGSWEKFKL